LLNEMGLLDHAASARNNGVGLGHTASFDAVSATAAGRTDVNDHELAEIARSAPNDLDLGPRETVRYMELIVASQPITAGMPQTQNLGEVNETILLVGELTERLS
jgi:hypothetical protein